MSRWHSIDCPGPEVDVPEDGIPICRACKASPNLEDIVQRAQDSSVLRTAIPKDTPIGSMNLSWPASVPWTRNGVPLLQSTHADAAVDEQETAAVNLTAVAQKITLDDRAPDVGARTSFVYSRRLSTTQFRLLRLDPVEARNRERLIHVDLETHEFDDSPEYETVSYTWSGEEGDSTPRNPIYVGPYWDVLVQTDNCASMLRDLMPRGHQPFRRLWVDAICINQIDIPERDRQVSRMGDIYRNCMRVVVYLPVENPRSVRPPGIAKANRRRTRLTHEVLLDLLRTRYFTRVWIIQELVLAPMVVFHLKDEDVYFSSLDSNIDWSLARAPWVAHIANAKTFGKLRLVDVLARTWNSEAADTRDKIFGVLGLLRSDIISHRKFEPDYSLSARDVFVGAVAYMILVEKQLFLLGVAVEKDHAALGYPSWSIDLTNQLSPFVLSDVSTGKVPRSWTPAAFIDGISQNSELYHIYPRSRAEIQARHAPFASICTCRCGILSEAGQDNIDRVTRKSIDCARGALTLDCIRIFREPISLHTAPHPTLQYKDSVRIFEQALIEGRILFEWLSSGARLRIIVYNRGKDQRKYRPAQYTLMVAGQPYGTPVLLFLQPEDDISSRSYVLKHRFPIVGITLIKDRLGSQYSRDLKPPSLCGNLFETLGELRGILGLTLNDFAEKVRAETQLSAGNDHSPLVTEDLLKWLFPGEHIILEHIFPTLLQIWEVRKEVQSIHENLRFQPRYNWWGFLNEFKAFLEVMCPDFQPRLEEGTETDPRGYFTFTYSNDGWLRMQEPFKRPDMVLNATYDDLGPAGRRSGQKLIKYARDEHQDVIVVTIELSIWCSYLLNLGILSDLRILRILNVDMNEARYEVRPEHRDVYVHKIPDRAREKLGFVWEHETITIL